MSEASAGTSNPEYVTARVRARRGSLFEEEDYRKLVRMSPAEIARFMEDTEYEDEINALGSRHSGVDLIEYALNKDFATQCDDILDWAEGRLYDLIARYLRKFDAWNVKTAFRGIYSGATREDIEDDFIDAGEFDADLLVQLASAESIQEVVERLDGTIFAPPLEDAYDDFEDSDVLVPLENAVDRVFYEHLLDGLRVDEETRLYHEFLQTEIDFRNALNALRLARSGADLDPSEYFIEGGRLFSRSSLARLAQDREELVLSIRESVYGDELDDALDELEETDSLIEFERTLDAALLHYADNLGHVFPLGVNPVISFILAKEREVDNIRAIARGREADMEPEEIEAELIIQ